MTGRVHRHHSHHSSKRSSRRSPAASSATTARRTPRRSRSLMMQVPSQWTVNIVKGAILVHSTSHSCHSVSVLMRVVQHCTLITAG